VIILALQIFISLMLVAGAVVLFVHTVGARTLEHADRLALAPLEDDDPSPAAAEPAAPTEEETR
jgi:hypothetical protein